MTDQPARPGPRDGSAPLIWVCAGVIVGLLLFLLLGARGPYGVIPFLVGGALIGGAIASIRARRNRPAPGASDPSRQRTTWRQGGKQ